jgi:hypothetical protein
MFKQQRRIILAKDIAKILIWPCPIEIRSTGKFARFKVKIGYIHQLWNKRI